MTFLTPLAALAALAALLPLGAAAFGRVRVRVARRALGLDAPSRWSGAARLGCIVAGIALLGLAAAQPAVTSASSARERTDVAVLFVVDSTRSMAASATPTSPTRLARAVDAAISLRAAIPDVPAGVATLTDRVLPDLLPVPDVGGFDGVMRRAVTIDNPPPGETAVVATNCGAIGEIPGGNYFEPHVTRRIVILLTDGESVPFDPSQVAGALPASQGYRFMGIRFWNANEAVYDSDGRAEPGYHPNPVGATLMASLAGATGGRFFSETQLGGAASYLRGLAASGPSVVSGAIVRSVQTLTPFVAGLAALLLLAAVAPAPANMREAARRFGRVRGRTTARRAGRIRIPAAARRFGRMRVPAR
jgi:hypothetical protein